MPSHTTPNRPNRPTVCKQPSADDHRQFTKELLRDLQALERMVLDDQIESDVIRIGAEQELFVVDDHL